MDVTECLELPFPECDPPLTKDASDIEQFRDLAEATDAAVEELSDLLTDTLTAPDSVRMDGGQNAAGSDIIHALNGFVHWDTAGMADTVADRIVIRQDGWYMFGGTVYMSTAANSSNGMRVDPLLNGAPFTSRQGPGFSVITEYVNWADMAFFRAGDQLHLMTHHTGNPATVFTYTVSMWALQVATNV
jgi:hypothetical protein